MRSDQTTTSQDDYLQSIALAVIQLGTVELDSTEIETIQGIDEALWSMLEELDEVES